MSNLLGGAFVRPSWLRSRPPALGVCPADVPNCAPTGASVGVWRGLEPGELVRPSVRACSGFAAAEAPGARHGMKPDYRCDQVIRLRTTMDGERVGEWCRPGVLGCYLGSVPRRPHWAGHVLGREPTPRDTTASPVRFPLVRWAVAASMSGSMDRGTRHCAEGVKYRPRTRNAAY